MVDTFESLQAYESLSKCPIAFEHPHQAVQLEGIGPKIVDMLTDKLKAYCEEHGLPMPSAPSKGKQLITYQVALVLMQSNLGAAPSEKKTTATYHDRRRRQYSTGRGWRAYSISTQKESQSVRAEIQIRWLRHFISPAGSPQLR